MNPLETVYEYFFNDRLISAQLSLPLREYLSSEDMDKNFNDKLLTFELMYKRALNGKHKTKIKKTLSEEFGFPFNVTDHFICRILCRYKDFPIDFLMRDVKYAYTTKKINRPVKGKYLRGNFCKILYDEGRNLIISVCDMRNGE